MLVMKSMFETKTLSKAMLWKWLCKMISQMLPSVYVRVVQKIKILFLDIPVYNIKLD